jgi:hypothetical protein
VKRIVVGLPSAGESVPVINMELDVICRKKRGKHALDIAHVIQIREMMMIHTILKSAQEIETQALNMLWRVHTSELLHVA